MKESRAKVVHYTEVPAQLFGPTAPGASIRWLIDGEHDGAPVYALRMIEIEPGGTSPHHTLLACCTSTSTPARAPSSSSAASPCPPKKHPDRPPEPGFRSFSAGIPHALVESGE